MSYAQVTNPICQMKTAIPVVDKLQKDQHNSQGKD